MNGKKVKTEKPINCDHCGRIAVIGCYPKGQNAYYVYYDDKLCYTCAKKARVI